MITDEDIRMFRAESRATGDEERTRCANAALGLPTSDGALGLLDRETCRLRIEAVIVREHTPGTSAQRLTADTITDEQIIALRNELLRDNDHGENSDDIGTCHDALPGAERWVAIADWGETRPVSDSDRREARARCVEILNARRSA